MKKLRWLWIVCCALMMIPATAQETAVAEASVPPRVMLDGLTWIHQGTNRCSAAALTIHLSYYLPTDAETYFSLARQELNTFGADASVRIEEMAQAARDRGLGAVVRRAGSVELMKQLVAAGFPVLVENSYYESNDLYRDWLSHNRVLVGYDDALQIFYFQDPLLGYPDGELVSYDYANFEQRWRPFNRDYLVLYDLEDEAAVQAILGEQWDMTVNAQTALEIAQAEIDAGQGDGFAYFNRGWAQIQLEQYEAAAESFDQALNLGLPYRMLWYEFGPFEAYLQTGRYEDVIFLANQQIANAGDGISVEEWFYFAGQAYEAQGNRQRAMLNYEVAVTRNTNFVAAAERLQALREAG